MNSTKDYDGLQLHNTWELASDMARPEFDLSYERCRNLERLIDEKRRLIRKLESVIEELINRIDPFLRFGQPADPKLIDDRDNFQRQLNIQQRELDDFLNDFDFNACPTILSSGQIF